LHSNLQKTPNMAKLKRMNLEYEDTLALFAAAANDAFRRNKTPIRPDHISIEKTFVYNDQTDDFQDDLKVVFTADEKPLSFPFDKTLDMVEKWIGKKYGVEFINRTDPNLTRSQKTFMPIINTSLFGHEFDHLEISAPKPAIRSLRAEIERAMSSSTIQSALG